MQLAWLGCVLLLKVVLNNGEGAVMFIVCANAFQPVRLRMRVSHAIASLQPHPLAPRGT